MPIPTVNYDRALFYGRRFAESNMRSTVTIVRKAPALFNDVTGELAAASPTLVYQGRARVSPDSGPLNYSFGDEQQHFTSAVISVPVSAPILPMVDDVVTVTAHPGDPVMVGRTFAVMDVESGGQWLSSRRLQVTGVQASPEWPTISVFDSSAAGSSGSGGSSVFVGTP